MSLAIHKICKVFVNGYIREACIVKHKILFFVLAVLSLSVWYFSTVVNTRTPSDEAFIELARTGTAQEVTDAIGAGAT